MFEDNPFRQAKAKYLKSLSEKTKYENPFHAALKKHGIRNHKLLSDDEYNAAFNMHTHFGSNGVKKWISNRKTDLKRRNLLKPSLFE